MAGARAADASIIVIGNLPFDTAGATATANLLPGEFGAMGFTMGADSLELESAILQLSGVSAASAATVFINDTPDLVTPLVSLGAQLIAPGASAPYTFTPLVPFTLLATTTYYLVYTPSGAQVTWVGDHPGNTPTGAFATDGDTVVNGGVVALEFDYQINAVPEPATLAIFGMAAFGTAWHRMRRRR